MLYKETVPPATLGLLKKIMNDEALSSFVLVGGTALALQLGHRISVDLDLFSSLPFDEEVLSDYLIREYGLELDFVARKTIKGEIEDVQIDCISHEYPWIAPLHTEENIRLSGLPDIAAMKLNAISGNGTRLKDFIDIAYLSVRMSLAEMLDAYNRKYNANPLIPLKSITFFDDVEFEEPIKMKAGIFNWKKIAKRLMEMQQHPNTKLPSF